jgi:chemotaxis protein CheD
MLLVEKGRSNAASIGGANRVIGISEMVVERGSSNVIVTYSLGSCVGVVLYDAVARVGGLIHCMLPLSKIDPAKAQATPAMFVDTGIPALLQAALDLGADLSRISVKVAGAGSPLDDAGIFNIGDRNLAVLRKILWKNNILIAAQETGGSEARTLYLDMKTGDATIRSGGQTRRF